MVSPLQMVLAKANCPEERLCFPVIACWEGRVVNATVEGQVHCTCPAQLLSLTLPKTGLWQC